MRVKLLKYADATLGRAAARLLPSPKKFLHPAKLPVRRILIIRPGGIGDAVLLMPALRRLQQTYPDASIHVLAETRNAAVFDLLKGIEQVLFYDNPSQLLAVVRSSYDLVIDTEQWHYLSAVVARLSAAPVLIGFGTNDRKSLFTHPVTYSQEDYEVESFLHLLAPIAHSTHWDRVVPFLTVRPDLDENAVQVLQPLGPGAVVAIFPGSSISERRWGTERYLQTARLLANRGCRIVVVGGKTDRPAGKAIADNIPGSLDLCGRLSLVQTAAVLGRCSLLITGDSGIMHIGYGLGVKMVALFGPGREKKWAPRSPTVRVVNKHLACSPCTSFGYTPRCTRNAACLGEITAEEVFQESMKLLTGGE